MVCIKSNTPRSKVHRALDDSPCVAQAGSGIVERFSTTMKSVCRDINMLLVDNCSLAEKAFELQSRGTVLGVGFNSSNLTWFLSEEKAGKVVRRCLEVVRTLHVDLKTVEKLMGSINDLSQMSKTFNFHKREGNLLLSGFKGDYNIVKMVPGDLKEELKVKAKIAESAKTGLPLAEEPCQPSLSCLVFYSDAASASFSRCNGVKVFHDNENKGVACIGGESLQDIWCWCRLSWPAGLLTVVNNEKGCSSGCKSTTLEAVGLLLPFVAFPDKVKGRNIVFKVDNLAVIYGWYKGYVKNNKSASEVLKAVHYLSGMLGTTVNVEHVDRVSNEMVELAHELSRRLDSRSDVSREALKAAKRGCVGRYLSEWLKNPTEGRSLCKELLKELGKSRP